MYLGHCVIYEDGPGTIEIIGRCLVTKELCWISGINQLGFLMWIDGEHLQFALPNLSNGQ